jgi:hypothetical protein
MPKSPPEKLAQALRDNLRRRKQAQAKAPLPPPADASGPLVQKPPEKQG